MKSICGYCVCVCMYICMWWICERHERLLYDLRQVSCAHGTKTSPMNVLAAKGFHPLLHTPHPDPENTSICIVCWNAVWMNVLLTDAKSVLYHPNTLDQNASRARLLYSVHLHCTGPVLSHRDPTNKEHVNTSCAVATHSRRAVSQGWECLTWSVWEGTYCR